MPMRITTPVMVTRKKRDTTLATSNTESQALITINLQKPIALIISACVFARGLAVPVDGLYHSWPTLKGADVEPPLAALSRDLSLLSR